MALHTNAGCTINGQGSSGSIVTSNCDASAPNQANNQGCAIVDTRGSSYGDGFNINGGGVYAMEWTEWAIKIWFWPRNQVPADVWGANPEPVNWGAPAGQFSGDCTINNFFKDHKIVFNIDFCGNWAGNVWSATGCSNLAPTCVDYVAGQPGAFSNAYWSINSLKVWSS